MEDKETDGLGGDTLLADTDDALLGDGLEGDDQYTADTLGEEDEY
ncbi:MAG: hypothetical protein AAB507_02345 [Patescibacteria group bacterium]